MQVLKGRAALPWSGAAEGCAVALGVFDGLHLGHQAVIARLREQASTLGLPAAVATFAEHPKQLLLGRAPHAITSLDHRLLGFRRLGVDLALVLDFDEAIRSMTALEFVDKILVSGLGLRTLVLGFDSKFGLHRGGSADQLPPIASSRGFTLERVDPVRLQNRAVSSTSIRESVRLGDLEAAAEMLGRPVSLLGTVIRGDARGRDLGFPTANLDLHHELRPPKGVYAALVRRMRRTVPAVVNVGERPTFDGTVVMVEVHLLDFDGDLYGEDLEVHFLDRLRDERAFASADELCEQIRADIETCRAALEAAQARWRIPGMAFPVELAD